MKTNRRWLLLALPLALTACGGDEDVAIEDAGMADTMAAAPEMDAGMGAMPSTLALQPIGDSGVMGQATLTPSASEVQVAIQLSGLTPGAHPGHIHTGSCDAVGSIVQPLPELTAGDDGAGTVDGSVAMDATTVMDGQHIVVYHGEGGTPVVCGTIVGHVM